MQSGSEDDWTSENIVLFYITYFCMPNRSSKVNLERLLHKDYLHFLPRRCKRLVARQSSSTSHMGPKSKNIYLKYIPGFHSIRKHVYCINTQIWLWEMVSFSSGIIVSSLSRILRGSGKNLTTSYKQNDLLWYNLQQWFNTTRHQELTWTVLKYF